MNAEANELYEITKRLQGWAKKYGHNYVSVSIVNNSNENDWRVNAFTDPDVTPKIDIYYAGDNIPEI